MFLGLQMRIGLGFACKSQGWIQGSDNVKVGLIKIWVVRIDIKVWLVDHIIVIHLVDINNCVAEGKAMHFGQQQMWGEPITNSLCHAQGIVSLLSMCDFHRSYFYFISSHSSILFNS